MSNQFFHIKLKDLLDQDPDKFEPRPRRMWAVIFCAEIILVIFVLVVHLYIYNRVSTDISYKLSGDSSGIREVKLNRRGLAEVIGMFEKKNAQFQDLVTSAPQIADPSELAPAPAMSEAVVSPVATSTVLGE